MTIRVRGMKTARESRDLMAALSGFPAFIKAVPGKVEGTPFRNGIFSVHCDSLDARGEQVILDRLPPDTLVAVDWATDKKPLAPLF